MNWLIIKLVYQVRCVRQQLKVTHRNTHIFVVFWCIIWAISNKTKACELLICRLLAVFDMVICGEGGIRTLDTLLAYTHFPGVLFRPLRHLSLLLGHAKVNNMAAKKKRMLQLRHPSHQTSLYKSTSSHNY